MGRPRSFDHDLANVMRHEGGLTLQELADQFGVTPQSIRYATDARVREYDSAFQREHTPWKAPCSDCGGPATARYREGTRCRECHLKAAAAPHVRPDTLLCGFCQEWKPDEEFGRHAQASAARRGRRRECRACDSARRSGYRFRLPEDVRRDRDRRDYASRRAAS